MTMRYLRYYRIKAGLSQMALAQAVGIHQAKISQYERGLEILPTHADRIAEVLDKALPHIKVNPMALSHSVGMQHGEIEIT